ncbi:MAG: peptidoglycan recognition protein family protein [Patescibacteria group bacterium]
MLKRFFVIILFTILTTANLAGPLSFSQNNNGTPANPPTNEVKPNTPVEKNIETEQKPVEETDPNDGPVDQSNILFPGCRLNALSSTENVTDEKKSIFFRGCIQDIIRFIIIFACIAAIFQLALGGINQMMPFGSSAKSNVQVIKNLVIGLFLLTVGWNLIPILNSSFANQNYLNLPNFVTCGYKLNGKCSSYDEIKTDVAKKEIAKYEKSKQTKKWEGTRFQNNYAIRVLEAVCIAKSSDAAYSIVDKKHCKENYKKFLESIAPKEEEKKASNSINNVDDSLLEKVPNFVTNTEKAKGRGSIPTDVPPLIVFHHTAGARASIEGNRASIETGVGPAPSVQFGIKDDPNKVDYFMEALSPGSHAVGTWNFDSYADGDVNSRSFGLEFYYNPDTGEQVNENQMVAGAKLVALLEKKFNSGPDQVSFHGEIDPEYRLEEPWNFVHASSRHGQNTEVKMSDNWPLFIGKVRSFGAWKSGEFGKMDDKKLALYIFKRNVNNGLKQSPNGSKAINYQNWLNNNR